MIATHHNDVGVVVPGPDVKVDGSALALCLLVNDPLGQLVVSRPPPGGGGNHVKGAAKEGIGSLRFLLFDAVRTRAR